MQRDDPAQRLADLMEQRRLALHLRWDDVASTAGITTAFLRKIRAGTRARPLTIAKLEAALRWEAGSIDAILRGGQPAEVSSTAGPSDAQPAAHVDPETRTEDEIETAIRELARRLNHERVRMILDEFARPPASERRYEDDREQRIWEIDEIDPVIRRSLIYYLRHALQGIAEEDRRPNAEVREFRPRG